MAEVETAYFNLKKGLPGHVVLIAVSKTKAIAEIEKLYKQGQRDFGENYVQELLEKKNQAIALGLNEIRFHFIGHLQTNKVKNILPLVECIHSVDSVKLAQEISKRALALGLEVQIFLQINIDEEESKSGFLPTQFEAVFEQIQVLPALKILGLMCIPDPEKNETHAFQKMKLLSDSLGAKTEKKLSMGMSSDYVKAIASGATHVRIGSALFGARS